MPFVKYIITFTLIISSATLCLAEESSSTALTGSIQSPELNIIEQPLLDEKITPEVNQPMEIKKELSQITGNELLPEDISSDELTDEFDEDDGLISVNFQNMDIRQVIDVLSDITQTTIIPHDDLSGVINVVSLERVQPEIVANVLESALMVKGYTLVKSGEALKVIPLGDTKQTNVEVRVGISPDQIPDQDNVVTQVMPLQYSSALQQKTNLQPLIGKHGNIIANERTNTLIVTDTSSNIKRLAKIIDQIEKPQPPEFQVKTFFINYGSAEKIANILNDLSKDTIAPSPITLPSGRTTGLEMYGEIEAFFEEDTNTVVVASAPINFPSLEHLIKELDIFPPQAMIEVILMDITLDDDFTMGIEFSEATNPASTTTGLLKDTDNDGFRESIFHSLLGLNTDAATEGFTWRILNKNQTSQALAFILQTVENSKVLSTPRIMAANNQESSITVGQEVPIIESSTTDLVNNVTNVDFRYQDIGIILNVTPRISRDNFVNMKVHAELTDLSPQTILNASVINKREADATIIVPDKHTVVLGGLIRDNNSDIQRKVPWLGDLPVVGNLFKKTETSLLKTELLIFLTPHIIQSTEDIIRISSPAYEKKEIMSKAQSISELHEAVQTVVGYENKKARKRKKETVVGNGL